MATVCKGSATGVTLRGRTLADYNFTVLVEARDNVISAGELDSQQTVDDVTISTYTPATVDHEHTLTPQAQTQGALTVPPVFSSLDEAIATVDQNGVVTRVSDGTVGILIRNTFLTRREDLAVSREGGGSYDVISWVAGTLGKHVNDAVDSRLVGANPATDKQIHDGSTYNATCWAADLDFTGISRGIPRCTLVKDNMVVFAEHYYPTVGATVTFLAADGSIVTRTIAAKVDVGPANASDNYATDIGVGRLSSAVPASITHYKVLPADVLDYAPGIAYKLPCVCLDQDENALVGDLYSLSATRALFSVPTDAQRLAFYEPKVAYDSGNGAFLIINGDLVLVSTWTFRGAGAGPNYSANIAAINTAMDSLETGAALEVVDLSGFTNFA
jgi:hypothetical protein